MNPSSHTTSAFPYTVPYTNPYTQRKTQPPSASSSSSSSLLLSSSQSASPQQELEDALKVLARSSQVPSTQNIEQLFRLVNRANERAESSSSRPQQPPSCWSLPLAENLVTFVVRIFGCHENINMTGRNPEGYPSTLYFLARSLDQWIHDDSIMYDVVVRDFSVQLPMSMSDNNHNQHHQHRGQNQNSTTSDSRQTLHSIQQQSEMSLLQVLHNLTVCFQDPIIQNPAMDGLSIIWRYLDRIQFLTSWQNPIDESPCSLDSGWWMPIQNEEVLASVAQKELLRVDTEEYPKMYSFPSRSELQIASTTILICLLKHDRTSWLHNVPLQDNDALTKLCQILMEGIHKLGDPNLTSNQSLYHSIACASLLCLMDHKETLALSNDFNRLLHSTKLLENAFKTIFGIFGASSPSGPRWTFEYKDASTRRWMEDFILVWSMCKDAKTRKLAFDALERHWRPHTEQCLAMLVTEDYSIANEVDRRHKHCRENFSSLVLLNSVHQSSLRGLLHNAMVQASNNDRHSLRYLMEPSQKLLQALLHLSQHPDMSIRLCVSSTMKYLLGGRGSTITHDEVARSIWNALDIGFAQTCLEQILNLLDSNVPCSKAGKKEAFRPLLLNHLDVLDLLLSSKPILKKIVHVVNAETLEVLIHLMTPKSIRIDQAGSFLNASQDITRMEDFDTDTPPANNLSRLDENSICIEKEEEEKATTGVDLFIRLAVATILSRFGYLSIDNHLFLHDDEPGKSTSSAVKNNVSSLRLLQSRIRSSVTEFFADSNSEQFAECAESANVGASMELTRRKFRLMVTIAVVPENEEFLASYMFSIEMDNHHRIDVLNEKITACNKQLELAAQREADLISEKERNKKVMDAQSVRFWRDVQRMKKTNADETHSKLIVFDSERKAAETRLEHFSGKIQKAEERAREADKSAKASHEAEALVRLELDNMSTTVKNLEAENNDLKRELEQRDSVIYDIKERMRNLEEDHRQSEDVITDQQHTIKNLQESRDHLEVNLNSLFSDLVKLSNMYETQEKQVQDLRQNNDSVSKKLQAEQLQREDTEARLRGDNEQLQAEKAKLEKKILRYKEKLESELQRRERKEESERQRRELKEAEKRGNPVAYFNNLNDSVSSSANGGKHVKSSSLQKRSSNSQIYASKSRGKENDFVQDSQMRRGRVRGEEHSSSSHFRARTYR